MRVAGRFFDKKRKVRFMIKPSGMRPRGSQWRRNRKSELRRGSHFLDGKKGANTCRTSYDLSPGGEAEYEYAYHPSTEDTGAPKLHRLQHVV